MKDLIKSVAVWASIAVMPLNMDLKDLNLTQTMKDKTNSELFMNFGKENFSGFVSNGENLERQNLTPINPKFFSNMMKQLVKVIIDDMPFLLRRVAIPVFFGWVSSIQRSLDNLDVTAMNMKEKQYKSVVFDYMWWIVKRVLISMNGDMKIWDYYNSIRRYYPNRNSDKIVQELETLWLKDKDMKNLQYPFKK